MDRNRTKRRAVLFALRRGLGLVRLESSVYAISRDGTERLVARAAAGQDVWELALEIFEPVLCLEWGCPDREVCGHERREAEESTAWDQHRAAMEAEGE